MFFSEVLRVDIANEKFFFNMSEFVLSRQHTQ